MAHKDRNVTTRKLLQQVKNLCTWKLTENFLLFLAQRLQKVQTLFVQFPAHIHLKLDANRISILLNVNPNPEYLCNLFLFGAGERIQTAEQLIFIKTNRTSNSNIKKYNGIIRIWLVL